MQKGSLSIEIVIILVLGVLVVAAVIGFLLGAFKPAAGGTSLDVTKTLACQKLNSQGCTVANLASIYVENFDANKDGKFNPGTECCMHTPAKGSCFRGCENPATMSYTSGSGNDNLFELCANYYGCMTDRLYYDLALIDPAQTSFANCCRKQVCGCPGVP